MAQTKRPARRPAARTPLQTREPAGDAKPGPQLVWLDPKMITWPEVRITSQYRDGEREALSKSIQGQGQQQPVGVYLVDGQYVGADGKNRCLDAIERGVGSIFCVVHQGTARDVLQSNIATALRRGHTNPLTVVETLWKAYNEEGIEAVDLAASSGMSVEWVERMLIISQASPAVKQALGEEMIAMGHAELLSRIEVQEEQEKALGLVLQNRWTVAELEEHLFGAPPGDAGDSAGTQRAPAVRNPRACTVCHTEQAHGTIQTLHICDACVVKLGSIGPEQARLAEAFRAAVPALKDAEKLLAGYQATIGQAEKVGRLVELLEGNEPPATLDDSQAGEEA